MPIIKIPSGLDVFALTDADSPEAKAFSTYLAYWDGISRLIVDTYGADPLEEIVAGTLALRAVQKLRAKPFSGDASELAKILLNGWAQELGLYAVDDDDPRLTLQNIWNNVQSYYASSASARALLYIRGGELPPSHAQTLRSVASVVATQNMLPAPWNLCCVSEKPLVFKGFATPPNDCHNLEVMADPFDITAKALKTTRRREIEAKVTQHKDERKLTRAPHGLRKSIDEKTRPTTVFDFLWRSRTRSNYGDPSMFYVGSLSQSRSASYVNSVQSVTSATMMAFETLVAQRAPQVLLDTAVHFISRDRSRISDDVLGARLKALGLIPPSAPDEDQW